MQSFSSIILRVGIGLVIIWFGLQQISDSSAWVAYLPLWTKSLSISQINLIYLNGWFELTFGTLLIIGFYTRIIAFVLTLHLLSVVLAVGYNEIGVRDFGLAIAAFSIFLHGSSDWSLDAKMLEYPHEPGADI